MANTKKKTTSNTNKNKSKSKDNNSLYICIAVAAVIIIVAVIAAVMINKNNNNGGNQGQSSSIEYSTVDETINYGEYDAMETLSKNIQNGYATGKVVKIDGIVSHPMSKYSIVQANSDGTKKIGTEFVIEGLSEADYPKDGDRIVITGEVVEKSPMYFIIKTAPKYVETK